MALFFDLLAGDHIAPDGRILDAHLQADRQRVEPSPCALRTPHNVRRLRLKYEPLQAGASGKRESLGIGQQAPDVAQGELLAHVRCFQCLGYHRERTFALAADWYPCEALGRSPVELIADAVPAKSVLTVVEFR